eukprot:jgi/Tetstr1/422216/TSEL_013068.t1
MRQIVEKKMLEARVVAPTQNISHKLADVHDFPAVKAFLENVDKEISGHTENYRGHAAFIDPRDWFDYLPRAYAESMPPVGLTNPGLWNPRNDEEDRYLTNEKKHATRDDYRHMLCYGVFPAAAHPALTDAVAALRAKNATARDTADANDLLDSAIRTIATNGVDGLLNALDDKRLVVSLQQAAKAQAAAQFKGSGSGGSGGGSGGTIRIKEQERAEHADRATKERADKNKDKDKIKGKASAQQPFEKDYYPADRGAELTIQEGVRIPFKHNRPPPNFHNGISMQDATPAQLNFLEGELARFVESCAWEFGTCRKWMETLLGVRHLIKKGDYMFSLDLQDGFYALGIAEADRDYFTVDVRGQLYRLAGLPMGWSFSPYYFVTLTQVFITHLRKPEPEPPSSSTQPTRSKRCLRQTRWRGARILPYVDDFLLFSASMEQALHLRQRVASILGALGLQRNPTKGFWEPCQLGSHLGVDIDSASGMFYAPADKLNRLSRQSTRLPLSGDLGRKILPAGAPLRGRRPANEREHDLDSHNMDEIISLSGLSDCFGMSDDEAGSASGGMGGSARVVTKSDSAYLLDAVALASVVVDARGACMLGLNDDLGSYPDMWVKDSGAYPHMVADSDSFVEYEQLAPPVEKFGADIWGPVGVTSIGGFRYVFGMTDYYSAYGWVVFMKSKDEAPRALLSVALLDNSGVGSTSDTSRLQEIAEAHRRVVDETDDVDEELEIEEEPLTAEELELGPQQPTLELTQLETNEGIDDGGQEEPIVQRAERDPYPARSRRAPGQWWVVHPENPNDDAAAMMAAAFAAVTQGVDEPITLKQALSGPFKEQWAQAVESEFNSLEKQGTIARFKARLVVQGCRQRHGIDYAETFAPTVKFTTIRVLFAIAVQYGWNIHQVDVDTAFLYAPVEEEIYMRPPPGYEQYDARGRPMVLRLLKSLYGLKQSPRNWHNTLHKFLVCYGFQQLKSDPGAYVYWQGGQLICILVVYVDDMIFAFKDAVWAADFKTALGARFDIKDLGVCAWALGMAVERDWDNATLKVAHGGASRVVERVPDMAELRPHRGRGRAGDCR